MLAILVFKVIVIEIGEAVGASIVSAMWTRVFPKKLLQFLPLTTLPDMPRYTAVWLSRLHIP